MEMRCLDSETTAISGPATGLAVLSRGPAGASPLFVPVRSVRALASPVAAAQARRPAMHRPIAPDARDKPRATRETSTSTSISTLGLPGNFASLIGDDGAGSVTQAPHVAGVAQGAAGAATRRRSNLDSCRTAVFFGASIAGRHCQGQRAMAEAKESAKRAAAADAGPTSGALHRYRSHTCGVLRKADVGKRVRLSGWVHRVRDHGGLLFIDLRDHYGLTQVVADPESPAFQAAELVRSEWVIRVDGTVRDRPDGTVNAELPTGEVEVFAADIEVLSAAKELPVPVFGEPDYPEDLRLQYRFLDLRRETLHANIMKRLAIIASIRRRMHAAGFNEFATPILTASSPEGARDFLVPSRIHEGKFYALPQAPQQYKQLIMMSGFDRYFQIAPCFRDEDPRAERLPGEFYQLDVEMSFITQDDVFAAMEPVIRGVFEEFADGKAVTPAFPRIP